MAAAKLTLAARIAKAIFMASAMRIGREAKLVLVVRFVVLFIERFMASAPWSVRSISG